MLDAAGFLQGLGEGGQVWEAGEGGGEEAGKGRLYKGGWGGGEGHYTKEYGK